MTEVNSDVLIGIDGKPRCSWAGAGDTALGRYHDEVWGTRTYDERALFEALTLGVFEVGLSWSIVFGKREAFRKAFRGFDVAKVARFSDKKLAALMDDADADVFPSRSPHSYTTRWDTISFRAISGDRGNPCLPIV